MRMLNPPVSRHLSMTLRGLVMCAVLTRTIPKSFVR